MISPMTPTGQFRNIASPVRRRVLCSTLALGVLVSVSAYVPALAQESYPSRPIKIIVPTPPGNAADVLGRLLGEQVSKKFNVPVIIENRPGAAGNIAANLVVNSKPDGYTLLMTSTALAISPAVLKSLPFDLHTDLTPIALITRAPGVFIARKDFPAENLSQFIAEIRRNGPKYSYASAAGSGSFSHLSMESFLAAIKSPPILHVPYKGSPAAITDIIGGQVSFMFDAVLSARPHIESGRLKAFAVASQAPTKLLPNVPAVMQSNIPGLEKFVSDGWVGLLAPKGTPAQVVTFLNREFLAALHSPALQERLLTASAEPEPINSPAEFGTFLREDAARWQRAAEAAKIVKE